MPNEHGLCRTHGVKRLQTLEAASPGAKAHLRTFCPKCEPYTEALATPEETD